MIVYVVIDAGIYVLGFCLLKYKGYRVFSFEERIKNTFRKPEFV